ncbi:MAG TPA: glutamyl-tRNA reductase [Planctomycetota bacterium]|nr:glutamyl-tRNA reductase [Planctomycetota bacterium]
MNALGPGKELVLVGASHRTLGVGDRGLLGVSRDLLPRLLAEWRALPGVEELFVLSTCNRTELVAAGPEAEALQATLRAAAFRRVPAASVYDLRGPDAVFHVFSVCSGLRSMVLGESEIAAQFKEAARVAREAGALGSLLEALVQQAMKTGKRVRTETGVGLGALSVASAAIELTARVNDDFARLSALVLGAGETGVLAARHFKARGLGRLTLANRTRARAEAAAAELGGEAASFDDLPALVARHEVIVVAVETPEPLFDAEALARAPWPASDAPKTFVDLSVPRAVDPSVAGFRDALLFDMDAIQAVTAAHREARRAEAERADRILVEEAGKFLAFRTYAALSPAMAELGPRFEDARAAWAAERGLAVDDASSRDLAKRLLAVALAQTKDATRLTQSAEALERAYRRYLERLG